MRFKCAYCGRANRLVDIPLTFRQRRIIKAVETLERDLGMPPSTQQIADSITVSRSTAYNELIHLEHTQEICRPNGKRLGWSIVEAKEMIAVTA